MNEMKGRTSQPAPSPLIPPPTSRGDASRDERSRLGDHIWAPLPQQAGEGLGVGPYLRCRYLYRLAYLATCHLPLAICHLRS